MKSYALMLQKKIQRLSQRYIAVVFHTVCKIPHIVICTFRSADFADKLTLSGVCINRKAVARKIISALSSDHKRHVFSFGIFPVGILTAENPPDTDIGSGLRAANPIALTSL